MAAEWSEIKMGTYLPPIGELVRDLTQNATNAQSNLYDTQKIEVSVSV